MTIPASFTALKRHALAHQCLSQAAPFGRGKAAVRKTIQHLGYIQVDTISVLERAHHHVLFSRVPNYQPEMLSQLLNERAVFEYWSHAAAFLPIEDYRYSLPYKLAIKSGQKHWYKHPDHKLMAELLARIRLDGPLRSRDMENDQAKQSGWWDWKPAKKALEQLYMQGDVMVTAREGFQKVYDLTERVLPAGIDTTVPTVDEFAQHLLTQQLRCHGLVSLKSTTYLRKNPALKNAVKALLDEGIASGELSSVESVVGAPYRVKTALLDQPCPRPSKRVKILSPFDNAVIQRERLKTLFEFDYQIECYVPEAKRQYGYFCLPLLWGERFMGRMDCKAHRKEKRLEIKALFLEPCTDLVAGTEALGKALLPFMQFQACDYIHVSKVQPEAMKPVLEQVLKQQGVV